MPRHRQSWREPLNVPCDETLELGPPPKTAGNRPAIVNLREWQEIAAWEEWTRDQRSRRRFRLSRRARQRLKKFGTAHGRQDDAEREKP